MIVDASNWWIKIDIWKLWKKITTSFWSSLCEKHRPSCPFLIKRLWKSDRSHLASLIRVIDEFAVSLVNYPSSTKTGSWSGTSWIRERSSAKSARIFFSIYRFFAARYRILIIWIIWYSLSDQSYITKRKHNSIITKRKL